jgi:hypothetical protein
MNLKWMFNETLIGLGSFCFLALSIESVTSEQKVETVTVTGRSGPSIDGAQWVLETDKGPLALNGLTYYAGEKTGAGAQLINDFKVGTTYCMHIHNPGNLLDSMEEYFSEGPSRPAWGIYGGKIKTDAACPVKPSQLKPAG